MAVLAMPIVVYDYEKHGGTSRMHKKQYSKTKRFIVIDNVNVSVIVNVNVIVNVIVIDNVNVIVTVIGEQCGEHCVPILLFLQIDCTSM